MHRVDSDTDQRPVHAGGLPTRPARRLRADRPTRSWPASGKILPLVLGVLAPMVVPARFVVAGQSTPPNFVLVMCDDLGWGDVGFNGGRTIKTPHLDAMAAAGMRFTRFYAASAVCSPTRGSVLTGRHPYRYGIPTANAGHMRSAELTLAELLGGRGYATGHFGKWHLGTLTTTRLDSNRGGPRHQQHYAPPWRNGFAVCFSTEAKVPTCDPMWKPRNAGRRWWQRIRDKSQAVPYGTCYWDERGRVVTAGLEGDDSRIIMDRALPFIESAVQRGQPFLAVVWFHAPHLPVVATARHAARYEHVADGYHRNYYGCVSALDDQMGRLRAALHRLGVSERTMVAFCSDNGPEGDPTAPGSAGPFRGRKRDLFEGGIRVPGLIEWPAVIEPGSVSDFPAVTSDYLPTILEAVGQALPDRRPLDGLSLLPVFAGELTERPAPIGFRFGQKVALVDNRYKIVRYGQPPRRARRNRSQPPARSAPDSYQLFDLINDPGETRDLAQQHPAIVTRMRKTLEAWGASCAASDRGEDYPPAQVID